MDAVTRLTTRSLRCALLGALVAAALGPVVHGGDISKNDGTGSLNIGTSWAGGAVPTAGDNILINNLTASRSVNVGTSTFAINGINYTSNFQFSIGNATAGSVLSIGAGGITKAAGTAPLIIGTNGNVTVSLAADQTWTIGSASGNNLQINGPVLTNGHLLSIVATTNGVFDLRTVGSATYDSNVTIGANVSVNSATANITLEGNNHTFDSINIVNGKVNANSIANYGTASSMGDGGTTTTIGLGGNLSSGVFNYIGTAAATSNRTFTLDTRGTASGINVASSSLTLNGALLVTGNSALTGNVSWNLGGAGDLVINGAIAGNATFFTGITKVGTGKLVLGANNTAKGNINVTAGTLQLGNGGTSGSVLGDIFNQGALVFNRSDSSTYAGAISGSGTVTQAGTGELTLSGANSYSGETTVASGTLTVTSEAALGTNPAVSLGSAGTSSGTLKYLGTGAGTFTKTITARGDGSDTIQNVGTGSLTLAGDLVKDGTVLTLKGGTAGITVAGAITGASPNSDLVVDGGLVTLTATNTYNGPTTITNGAALTVASTGALPTAPRSAVTLDPIGSTGGSSLLLQSSQAVASLTGTSTSLVDLANTTLTVGSATGTSTFTGVLSGTGTIIKDGTSTWLLAGANTFTGQVQLQSGVLGIAASNTLADTSDLVFYGGIFATSSFTDTVGTLTLAGTAILNFAGGGSLAFANSSGTAWTNGAFLELQNWTPNASLRFGTDASGLTSLQLAQIIVPNTTFTGFSLDDQGYLQAVPEPSTYALLALGGVICAWFARRRRRT